jgi:hypothetical protein
VARASTLTSERRAEIAKKVESRWRAEPTNNELAVFVFFVIIGFDNESRLT